MAAWQPLVDAVRGYYAFLADDLGAIPPDCIDEPPAEGWSSINQESLGWLEKTDAVIELLRHMPYITSSSDHNTAIAFATNSIDYRQLAELKLSKDERWQYIPEGKEEFPAHVVVLTWDGGDHYGSELLIDMERGVAIDYQPQAPRKAGVPEPEITPEIWRYSETLPVAELLGLWERNFRTLEWTVDPFNAEQGMMLRHDRATDEVRQIYRDHGWSDDFRQVECREALREWHRTIDDRLRKPGHNLHEIVRQPPGPHESYFESDLDDGSDESNES